MILTICLIAMITVTIACIVVACQIYVALNEYFEMDEGDLPQ